MPPSRGRAIMAPMIRLADGVMTGRDQRCWVSLHEPYRRGVHRRIRRPAPPWPSVSLIADGDDVWAVITALGLLVESGGVVAAGAGVDLGGGLLVGTVGREPAEIGAMPCWPRFGCSGRMVRRGSVTGRPCWWRCSDRWRPGASGAAAGTALEEGRWSALTLASAASDVLGPEKLEQVLALDAPAGIDPLPHGVPSILASQFGQVLASVAQPRRLRHPARPVERVCDEQEVIARRQRLCASQVRVSRMEELTARVERFEDDFLVAAVQAACGTEPTIAQAGPVGTGLQLLVQPLLAWALFRTPWPRSCCCAIALRGH